MDDIVNTARAILADWDDVKVTDHGGLFQLSGSYQGQTHGGARADLIGLARDLDAIAKATWAQVHKHQELPASRAAAADVSEPETVEPVDEPDVTEPAVTESDVTEPDGDDTFADMEHVTTAAFGRTLEGFNPAEWTTLSQAQAALRIRIVQEHLARTQTRSISLDRALELALLASRTQAEEIELAQHVVWRDGMKHVDATKDGKLAAVAALDTLDEARVYAATVGEGWSP
jgi:hypothetical protein